MSKIKRQSCYAVERFQQHKEYESYCEDKQLTVYVSPDFLKEFATKLDDEWYELPLEFSCKWPACNCKLSEVSGMFHQEKIDWIVRETINDPKFKHRIRI
jgi:hypothetical protein